MHLENKQTKQTTPRNKHLLTNKRMDRSAWVRKVNRKKKKSCMMAQPGGGEGHIPLPTSVKGEGGCRIYSPPLSSLLYSHPPASLPRPSSLSILSPSSALIYPYSSHAPCSLPHPFSSIHLDPSFLPHLSRSPTILPPSSLLDPSIPHPLPPPPSPSFPRP